MNNPYERPTFFTDRTIHPIDRSRPGNCVPRSDIFAWCVGGSGAMTDPLTQLRDALQTVITTSEHALVPRALLRDLLARMEAAEAVVEAGKTVRNEAGWLTIQLPAKLQKTARHDDCVSVAFSTFDVALSAHAKLKDATP